MSYEGFRSKAEWAEAQVGNGAAQVDRGGFIIGRLDMYGKVTAPLRGRRHNRFATRVEAEEVASKIASRERIRVAVLRMECYAEVVANPTRIVRC